MLTVTCLTVTIDTLFALISKRTQNLMPMVYVII